MHCPSCGSLIPDRANYCPNCSGKITEDREWFAKAQNPDASESGFEQSSHDYGMSIPPGIESSYGVTASTPAAQPFSLGQTPEDLIMRAEVDGHGMKWYRFGVVFAYFAVAAINVLLGLAIFLTIFARLPLLVQTIGPTVSAVGPIILLYALLHIIAGVLSVFLRFRMATFNVGAIKLLYVVMAMLVLSEALRSIAENGIMGVIFLLPIIALVALNVLYYNKRAYLFVNE